MPRMEPLPAVALLAACVPADAPPDARAPVASDKPHLPPEEMTS